MTNKTILTWVWAMLLLLTVARGVQAQVNQDLLEEFRQEAPKHWERYEAFATRLQGSIHRRATLFFPDRGFNNDVDELRYTVKQNPRSALLGGQPIKHSRNDVVEYYFLSNPQYCAEIRRKGNEDKDYLLKRHDPDPNAVILPAPGTIRDWAFVALCPHFSFNGLRLSKCLTHSGFQLKSASAEQVGDRRLVRIEFEAKLGSEKQPSTFAGSLFFDPVRMWCLHQVRERASTNPDNMAEATLKYDVDDHPSGFPIVRHETRVTESTSGSFGKGKSVYEIDYDMSINERVPDSEFTLSAFGLPEPLGVTWTKPTPRYVWILIGAGVAGVLAVVFYYLARRKRAGQRS